MKHVIIIGAGFAGLNAAKVLGDHPQVQVTVIDQHNHHLFQPLLYQVAMAGLSATDIAIPIRSILSKYRNIEVFLGEVEKVSLEDQTVYCSFGVLNYDYLVLACGAQHSYFGHDEWETWAPGLKTIEQALEIRRRVLSAFERAERAKDETEIVAELTFVIVGAGPTGVELAGSLAEICRFTLKRDFRHIDASNSRIILIDGGDRVLATYHPKLSERAERALKRLGVEVIMNEMVTRITSQGVFSKNKFYPSRTVLWAAGVKPSELNLSLGAELDKQGRILVNADLTVPSHSNVFVTGDATCLPGSDGKLLPGLAAVAIQQGKHASLNILNSVSGKDTEDFVYNDRGIMATVGRNFAVVQGKKLRMSGFFAWILWLGVHIYFLIGFRNRFSVFLQWFWSYCTYKRGARLIVPTKWRSHDQSNSSKD